MRKISIFTVLLLLITILSLTGCTKKTYTENVENINKTAQAIEFLYDLEGNPNSKVSNEAIKTTQVTVEQVERIPYKYGERIFNDSERELYAKQGKAMQPVKEFTDKFISILYSISPKNIEQQAQKMANNSIDQVKPEYDKVVMQIKQKNITRKYESHRINFILPIDARIIGTGEVVPGRIISVTVVYVEKGGKLQEDDIDLYIINLEGTWKLSRFIM